MKGGRKHLGVELVSLKPKDVIPDGSEARLPADLNHQTPDDVVGNHRFELAAGGDHLEKGLVVDVEELRSDVALQPPWRDTGQRGYRSRIKTAGNRAKMEQGRAFDYTDGYRSNGGSLPSVLWCIDIRLMTTRRVNASDVSAFVEWST